MCRPRFCEVQEDDAAEVQQFQQASAVYGHRRREHVRSQYRQKTRDQIATQVQLQNFQRHDNDVRNVCEVHDDQVTAGQRVVASGVGTVAMSLFSK